MKNPAAVSLGRLGGKAGRGKAKARSSAQARRRLIRKRLQTIGRKVKIIVDDTQAVE